MVKIIILRSLACFYLHVSCFIIIECVPWKMVSYNDVYFNTSKHMRGFFSKGEGSPWNVSISSWGTKKKNILRWMQSMNRGKKIVLK